MAEEIYGRVIIIKNCGRFLNIASDFGSEYKTHPFLTEQMVYAGLTRENELLDSKDLKVEKGIVPDDYNFNNRYNIPNGRYFTCGHIIDKQIFEKSEKIKLWNKNRDNSDTNNFNSIDETNAGVQDNKLLPKFGNIEYILPNNYFLVFIFTQYKDFLKKYYLGQTFYMGKKRTMFQIDRLSEVVSETNDYNENDDILRLPIQVTNEEINEFQYYNILTVTQRYILIRGKLKEENKNYYWKFRDVINEVISLPSFFVNKQLV